MRTKVTALAGAVGLAAFVTWAIYIGYAAVRDIKAALSGTG